jgi:hypothetical protein
MADQGKTHWRHAYQVAPSKQLPGQEMLPGQETGRQDLYRKFWAFLSVLALPSAFAIETVKDRLLELNVLNSHDLWPLAQSASATSTEYLLNARYWDVATYLLMLASVPVFLWGFVVLAKEANH